MPEELNHLDQVETDHEIESAAVAGAAAVQRLIADRNNLRSRLATLERELMASRATQEEFKRRLGMLHQRYLELARKVVSQMEQFDGNMREALKEKSDGTVKGGANIPGLKQFDKNGLPTIPEPSVATGLKNRTNGNGALPIEP
jgi:hypothetical protein